MMHSEPMPILDALVVGAGPAGALAARELARAGLDVLLVDRARFPRKKVCGGCLGASALATLEALELAPAAAPLTRMRCAARGRSVELAMPAGAVVDRATFDAALVDAAAAAGARFEDATRARLLPATRGEAFRRATLEHDGVRSERRARVVIDASGLGPGLESDGSERVAASSRIGFGWTCPEDAAPLEPGVVEMAVGRDGYAGLVRLADGRLDLAAALDPRALRSMSAASGALRSASAASVVDALRREAGLGAIVGLDALEQRGTPQLSRRPARVATARRLVLGDAAGYVEPFTGEGIGWALESARRAAALVVELGTHDARALERAWEHAHRSTVRTQQRACAVLAHCLRSPRLVGALIGTAARWPRVSEPLLARLARGIHAPSRTRQRTEFPQHIRAEVGA